VQPSRDVRELSAGAIPKCGTGREFPAFALAEIERIISDLSVPV
jgi:hypothetical protein